MTPKERAAMQQALEALEKFDGCGDVVTWDGQWKYCIEAITALREALEKPAEQEPAAWIIRGDEDER